jgi:hypothetical protein
MLTLHAGILLSCYPVLQLQSIPLASNVILPEASPEWFSQKKGKNNHGLIVKMYINTK